MTEEEKEAIEKLSGKKNETTWHDTIREIKREKIKDVVVTRQKYITLILNYIDKLQKENKEKDNLIDEIIKRIPLEDGNGNHATNKDNLLENLDIFIDEWNRLEDKEDEEIEFASINWVRRSEYNKLKKDLAFYKEIAMKGGE